MSEFPVDFCIHLARAVAAGQKTMTYKPLSRTEIRLREAGKTLVSPYGAVGDVLWVREPYGFVNEAVVYCADYAEDGWDAVASLPNGITTPTQVMTREQVRSLLTVQSVDIVNLQELTEILARAAGTIPSYGRTTYLSEFKAQWDWSYKQIPWASNPLCWRVTFVRQ